MTNEFEYYLIYGENIPNVPTVELDKAANGYDVKRTEEPLDENKVVKMRFLEPYPKNPEMVDFHQDGIVGAFSKKVYEALSKIPMEIIQLVPAEISDPKNKKTYKDYYYLHNYNKIKCLDKELSEIDKSLSSGIILSISKMVLDTAELAEIPLEERLIMRLGEFSAYQLFHKTVVDAIMATNPRGIRFVKVEDYHFGAAFD